MPSEARPTPAKSPDLTPKTPVKHPEWHRIALQLLLDGQKPTTQALIDRRGGGSMTTATAALNEFYESYLPSVLSAATLGAPAEIAELVGELWKRLAEYARAAAAKEFDDQRTQLQAKAQQLDTELASTKATLQAQGLELDAAMDVISREEARALGAEGQLAEQQRIVADLNRALSQLQRDIDRQAGELAQAKATAAERKTELSALREEHRTALAGFRGQHRDELRRLSDVHEAAVKALGERASAVAADHERAMAVQQAACQELRDQLAETAASAKEREQLLSTELVASRAEHAILKEQIEQAVRVDAERVAERDRLTAMVGALQESVRTLSALVGDRKQSAKSPKRATRAAAGEQNREP